MPDPRDVDTELRDSAIFSRDDNGDPWPEPPEVPDTTPPDVAFTEPAAGLQVALGTTVAFKFKATDTQSIIQAVEWSQDGVNYVAATRVAGVASTWSANVSVNARGSLTVWVRATDESWNTRVISRSVVGFDATPPEMVVDSPAPEVTDAPIKLVVRARDTDPTSGVKAVRWSLNGAALQDAKLDGEIGGWPAWRADIPIPVSVPPGGTPYTIVVRAYNHDDKFKEETLAIRAVDRASPKLEISEPQDGAEIPGTSSGATVKVRGTASDTHNGTALYSGIERVEWNLDGGAYAQATPKAPGDWSSWSVDVPIPAQDQHTITVRCLDKQGNPPNPLPRKVVAALPFEVKDFGPRSYLKDLLDFASRRLKRVGGTALNPRLFSGAFHQPFEALVSSASEAAAEPVHQVRLSVEVLRDFLPGYAEPRPLARWGFDEGSGTTAQDASGNGNVGTLQGPTRVAGKVGTGALDFDGVDDVVKLGGEAAGRDVTNDFSVAFWANPQATHEIDVESTAGAAGTAGQRYAIDPLQGGVAYGSPEHACAGVSVGTNGVSVYEHSDGYMPALLVHQAAVSGWTHVAVVYENRRPRLYLNGVLAKTGLISPKSFVHLNPQTIGGMGYGYFRGQLDDVRFYDRVLSLAEVRGLISPSSTGEYVWVEDNLPAGAVAQAEGGDTWSWVTSDPTPFSGTRAHQSAIAAGKHQHYFTTAADAMAVNRGDRLFAYVYLDPARVPEEVMLQWNAGADGGWDHRAYWGSNKITDWGTDGTESRRYMGPLPSAGRWVRLEAPANQVGLEGRVVGGVAFALYGGRATWDRAGKTGYRVELEKAEAGYRRAAYLELLSRTGTSYEEIRLSRAAGGARKALADRLGITLSATRPDQLDRLLLQPDQVTEADLERLFGLRATTRAPLDPGAIAEPEVLSWQKEYLRTLWKDQDRAGGAGTPPIIDPDLIGTEDLANPLPGNAAFDLWNTRKTWMAARISDLRSRRESKTSPLEGFDFVVGGVLAPLNLTALAEDRVRGVNIEPKLREKQLGLAAFDYLVRIRNLAAAGSVLPSEWEDVYAILAQVLKLRAWEGTTGWRAEERLKNLSLGPDHFNPLPATDMPEELPAWRATRKARSAWHATLRARIDQQDSTVRALLAAVDATEETTLPLLRDALVAAVGAGRTDRDVAEDLTQRLLIDVKSSGQPRTTRTNQAVETLQGILFSLRTGRFKERASALGPNPAAGWVLDQRAAYKEEQFDQEYRWMGSYDTWRAAMFVFLYPENVLLPGLREDPTPGAGEKDPTDAFSILVSNLRSRPGLTPEGARDEARTYLSALLADPAVPALAAELKKNPPGWSGAFEITDQLDEARLRLRANFVKTLWDNPNLQSAQTRTYLREVFYFVPLQLALQLQQAGQYLTALDWFQSVYAYDLPTGQRKVYDALKLDPAAPSPVNRTVEWLLQSSLNPHRIASTRKDAYTRFTLLSLARCFVEFADAEFTRATDEAIPRARALYANALDLLSSPEMQQAPTAGNFPQNPVPGSVRLRAELNLFKLRTGRNIAGLQRQVEPAAVAGSTDGLPVLDGAGRPVVRADSNLRPTPYYYAVLIERAKHLAGISQQIEAAYLSALERTDAENYGLLQAGHDLDLAQEGVELQKLKGREATDGEELARRQQDRTQVQVDTYAGWIGAGFNRYENAMIQNYKDMRTYRNVLAGIDAALTTAQALTAASSGGFLGTGAGAGLGGVVLVGALAAGRAGVSMGLNNAETQSQINSFNASHERRKQEWELQKSLAEKDLLIGLQQMQLAHDRVQIVEQEYDIARIQADQAKAIADFLANKFTNAELYEWMSGILAGVYGYFLQQATAVALLAQHQLTFERQETPPSIVQADYWLPPSDTNGSGGPSGEEAPDRRGMTGSARLLQDVYRLDQYAFETNERKLQLSQTFSLARTFPLEFQDFRQTGRLPFATPMEMFDRVFPGHYLRLIRRVRTSVVALVPPTHGIKAMLQTSGISRVVAGDTFESVVVKRDPELVALSSPMNATGLFELDPQSEMLLPFEGMGVDTSWELQMPRAANPFDYRTIADVMVTFEYTALHSNDYRRQVIESFDTNVGAERPFSLRDEFPDQWYDLHNPDGTATPMTVRFTTTRDDYPPNAEDLRIEHLVLYFVGPEGATGGLRVPHLYLKQGASRIEAGETLASTEGIVSTRGGSGAGWAPFKGAVPVGEWELALPDDARTRTLFEEEQIEDLLFVVSYSGVMPEWPA